MLPEIVRYFHTTFPSRKLGIEPLEECGRCEVTGVREPNPMEYARQFVRAFQASTEMSGRIKNSVTRLKYGNSTCYCGANGLNFAVNYEGNVTSCTRVTCQDHPASPMFYYGRYDSAKRGFDFDLDAYTSHGRYIVQSIPECESCFAKFSCKGGCLHLKANRDPDSFWKMPLDPERCEAMRHITTGLFRIQLGLPID